MVNTLFQIIYKLEGFLTLEAFELFLALNKYTKLKGSVLEIGVFCGRSLLGLAVAFKYAKKVIGVDPFYINFSDSPAFESEAEYLSEVSRKYSRDRRIRNINEAIYTLDKLYKYKLTKRVVLKKITQEDYLSSKKSTEKFSVCHVDGEHTFESVNRLLNNLSSILNVGGLLIVDDILNPGFPGIAEAIYSHKIYKKELFPIIYAFNKGVFIYRTNDNKVLIDNLRNIYANRDYSVKKLSDNSIVVEKNFNSISKIHSFSIHNMVSTIKSFLYTIAKRV